MTHIIKYITFELHNSFPDPLRDIMHPPYELTETGWGEFDLIVRIHFQDDVQEPPLELFHHLQLGLEEKTPPQRKPHVHEVYEEIVFWEPTETFYNRVKNFTPATAPSSQLAQYFGKFEPDADYVRIQTARRKLAPLTAHFKMKMAELEAQEKEASMGIAV